MDDFCQQCSIAIFGKDMRDLAGITTKEDYKAGKAALVICEGCGYIQVDPEGKCITKDCLENHGESNDDAEQ